MTGDGQFDYEDVAVLAQRSVEFARRKISEMSPRKKAPLVGGPSEESKTEDDRKKD